MNHNLTSEERTDINATKLALILYGVRNDCDDSMELIELVDRKIINYALHDLAHMFAELITALKQPAEIETALRRLIDQMVVGDPR